MQKFLGQMRQNENSFYFRTYATIKILTDTTKPDHKHTL